MEVSRPHGVDVEFCPVPEGRNCLEAEEDNGTHLGLPVYHGEQQGSGSEYQIQQGVAEVLTWEAKTHEVVL